MAARLAPQYPSGAFSGIRAKLPDWLIGLPSARDQQRAVNLLRLVPGDSVCDVSCGSGFNLKRLVRAVGPGGRVIGVADNEHLYRESARKIRAAGWNNVELADSLSAVEAIPDSIAGIIVSYDPPIFQLRPDLFEAAWGLLKPGGRISLVAGRCTTRSGRLVAPLIRGGLWALGHGGNWHYWTVHEPWKHLEQLAEGGLWVEPRLGFQYLLWAEKACARNSNG
jgi:SAM-dependent methyltransferase